MQDLKDQMGNSSIMEVTKYFICTIVFSLLGLS